MLIRIVLPEPSTVRREAVRCRACGLLTSHGKPYCFDHVELNRWASIVAAQLRAGVA